MAFIKVENVKISGISACVPKQIEDNASSPLFDAESLKTFIATTGVERKRKSGPGVCTSDLCVAAAEKLIAGLNWSKEDIKFLIFVSQSPDYFLPSTSPIIQNRMGLSIDCFALDISLGCSGWVYGMSVISSLMSAFKKGKGLLLMGDLSTKGCSPEDKSTYPLFGDAGTATALEYAVNAEPLLFGMNSDGSGYKAIIINDGLYNSRNPGSKSSFDPVVYTDGIVHSNFQLTLDGMDVFSFGIKRAPESVNKLIEEFHLEKDQIDYFLFHQANFMMNEQIRKKLKLPAEKVPYSLKDFGNTSSASIPLTMVTQLKNELETKPLNHIACGFGVGLSWGSVFFKTDKITVPPFAEI
jgi:3-oxoacyl-[acyl-carrier-protein] synthase-3